MKPEHQTLQKALAPKSHLHHREYTAITLPTLRSYYKQPIAYHHFTTHNTTKKSLGHRMSQQPFLISHTCMERIPSVSHHLLQRFNVFTTFWVNASAHCGFFGLSAVCILFVWSWVDCEDRIIITRTRFASAVGVA
jgi:hypothetical protein